MDPFVAGVGTTTAALFVLMVYSILYKENVLFRFAEHTVIGVGVGYVVCTTLRAIYSSTWMPIVVGGNLQLLIPVTLGILMYFMFIKRLAWLSLWPTALLTGLGVGLSVRGAIQAQFVQQIDATIILLQGVSMDVFNNLLIIVSTTFVVYYFLFSVKFKSTVINSVSDNVRQLARYFLMAALGVTFAGCTLTWIVNIITRIQFLLFDWLHLG